MELFRLEPGLAVWTWIAFGILFLILWKFVLPPLIGNIKRREQLIAKSVTDAEKIEERLRKMDGEYAEIIKKAKAEADTILLDTRKESEQLRKKLIEKAEEEAAGVMERTKEKIKEEREVMLRSLEEQIAGFVCDASEKIIGTSFTTEKDREWTKELAKSL